MVGVTDTDHATPTELPGDTSLIRSNTCSSEFAEGSAANVKSAGDGKLQENLEKDAAKATSDSKTPAELAASNDTDDSFEWSSEELKKFWLGCFAPGVNVYSFDGLHPKALCSKICNDVLRTNININSSNMNPNDRILCFDVLANLEERFIECGIIEAPTPKPGATNPNQVVYKRVYHTDFNQFGQVLSQQNKTLEQWARERVEESIKRLSPGKRV